MVDTFVLSHERDAINTDVLVDIYCWYCNGPVQTLTTKNGQNKGKKFYKCQNQPSLKCLDFFQWEHQEKKAQIKSKKEYDSDRFKRGSCFRCGRWGCYADACYQTHDWFGNLIPTNWDKLSRFNNPPEKPVYDIHEQPRKVRKGIVEQFINQSEKKSQYTVTGNGKRLNIKDFKNSNNKNSINQRKDKTKTVFTDQFNISSTSKNIENLKRVLHNNNELQQSIIKPTRRLLRSNKNELEESIKPTRRLLASNKTELIEQTSNELGDSVEKSKLNYVIKNDKKQYYTKIDNINYLTDEEGFIVIELC
jgi:hypothetical protein